MKSSTKTKSFHAAVRGNFPTAHDFSELDTYMTTRRRVVANRRINRIIETIIGIIIETIIGIIIETIIGMTKISGQRPSPRTIRRASRCHRTANDPLIESSPWNRKRSVERVIATELQTIRRSKRRHNTRKPPAAARESTIRLSGKRDDS